LGCRPAKLHGIKNGQTPLLQNSSRRRLKETPIQQKILDLQANFADPGQQPPQTVTIDS